jgi:DNA-binding GntR family transcriptional regulator
VLLVRDFIAHAPASRVSALGTIVDEVAEGAAACDIEGLVRTMRRFYAVLTEGADNSVAADTLESLHARINRLRVLSMKEPGRAVKSVEEISRIVDAIAARDVPEAESATRAYVMAAKAAALRQLTAGGGG